MRASGYSVLDMEPAPSVLSPSSANEFGYGLYSARYGNIYTSRQLVQLALEAFGEFRPADWIWEKGCRYFDALRPSVEPLGLGSPEEVAAHRALHLKHVRRMLKSATVMIFTFGLTEAWEHTTSGTVYSTAPGVIAGTYDPTVHRFKNLTFSEVMGDFLAFRDLVRRDNPGIKFLVTVSPVPLTATASGEHVLSATVYSKSVLRAVAGQLAQEYADVDYFPSYEIVAGHQARGFAYDANLRTVNSAGVDVVMRAFFAEHQLSVPTSVGAMPGVERDVQCEEALLEAFA